MKGERDHDCLNTAVHQNNITDNLNQWNKISSYSKWMFEVYEKYVGKRILDIGGGVGTVINYYIDKAEIVVTTELFDNQIEMMRERFKTYDYFHAFKTDITEDDIAFLGEYRFDTIICINVLEHIKNDLEAIYRLKQLLSRGGGNNYLCSGK